MTCKKGKDNLYSIVFSTLTIVPRKLPGAELKITPFFLNKIQWTETYFHKGQLGKVEISLSC